VPIDSTHPDYGLKMNTWQTLRDAHCGSEAIRQHKERYIPMPGGMSDKQFEHYLNRGEWYNATARTVEGLTGEVFRKQIALDGAEALEEAFKNITGQGQTLESFAQRILAELLLMGHYGVLLDVRTDARGGVRPIWAGYPVERILNWRLDEGPDGQMRLVHLVLAEQDWGEKATDRYVLEQVQRFRELILENGVLRVARFERLASGEMLQVDTPQPTRLERPLDRIPFVFFGPDGMTWELQDAPLLPLVQINLRHWRHSCDYEHGMHLTALPTLVITGHDTTQDATPDGHAKTKIVLGSQGGICLPEAEAKAYLLEYMGQGLGALENALQADKQDMASLGARLLEESPLVEEKEVAVIARQAGQGSVLKRLAGHVSQGLSQLARWSLWWQGAAQDPDAIQAQITLSGDYLSSRLSAPDLSALMAAVQEGLLSKETWYYNLRQGEITEPGIDFPAEEARIKANPHVPPTPPAPDLPAQAA
jgi:hypothetical protein